MFLKRIIPVLLLDDEGLVKTINFNKKTYLGDPVNTIKIFNEKEVDEIIVFDINCSRFKKNINFKFLYELAGECFVPLCYGGGINNIDSIARIINIGFERVSLNTSAILNPELVRDSAIKYGSSTIIVSIDYKKDFWAKHCVYSHCGRNKTSYHPVDWAKMMESSGAGEILLQSIDRDGTFSGFDFDMLSIILESVSIPVTICGGAKNIDDINKAFKAGVSGAAAGSLFVFKGDLRAKLISYPSRNY